MDGRLAEVLLTVEPSDGSPPQVFSGPAPTMEQSLAIGDINVTDAARFTLEGFAADTRLVAFGAAGTPVDISAKDDVVVSIPFRRPYAYVGSQTKLRAFDAADRQTGRIDLDVNGGASTAVATTPDGLTILTAGGGTLTFIDSGTHTPSTTLVPIGFPDVSDLKVAPSGRYAVGLHADGSGISIVDLEAAAQGAGTARFVAVPQAGAVAVTDEVAWVATNTGAGCVGESSANGVPLATEEPIVDIRPLGGCAWDLDYDGRSGRFAVAIGSRGLVLSDLSDPGNDFTVPVSWPMVVTISAGRAVAVGHSRIDNDDHLTIGWAEMDNSASGIAELPTDTVAQSAVEFDSGDELLRVLAADLCEPSDVSMMPDGALFAVLVHEHYHGDDNVFFGAIDADTWEYLLLDQAGNLVQQKRTDCTYDLGNCGPVDIEDTDRFRAPRVAILNGDR